MLKNLGKTLALAGAFALTAVAGQAQAQVVFSLASGTACGGAPSATFTAGGAAQTVTLCVTTGAANPFCGASIRLLAPAGQSGLFTVTNRTLGSVIPDPSTAAPTFPVAINNPADGPDFGGTPSIAAPTAGGATTVLATFTIQPTAGATGASYVVSTDSFTDLSAPNPNCTTPGDPTAVPTQAAFTFSQVVLVNTAPTASIGASATLTAGSGSVPVTVATAGSGTASLALACTIPAGTASFAVASGGTRNIAAPATLGANAPAIGLTCVPQATSQTATLTCAQTATPGPNPASLTSTITCPAAAAASIVYTATPAALTFVGLTSGTPTATQPVTVAANAGNTAALNLASCAFGGANAADFSFSPAPAFPVNVAAGGSTPLPVRFTPAAADSAARTATLTCQTPNATAAGTTSFVVNLNGTNPGPVPITIAPTTPAGNVVLPVLTIGATPAFVTTALNFNVTGGAGVLTCTVAGAGYTATGSPLNLVVGTTGTVTVTYTGATAGDFIGTLTCTSTGPAVGGPFVYNLSTTVQAAPAIGPTVQVPTLGALALSLLGLLIAGFGGLVQRRQVK